MATRITIEVESNYIPKYTLQDLMDLLENSGFPVTELKSVYRPEKSSDVFKDGRWR